MRGVVWNGVAVCGGMSGGVGSLEVGRLRVVGWEEVGEERTPQQTTTASRHWLNHLWNLNSIFWLYKAHS